MGVEAAPPAQGSTHTPISAGETAERVPGTLRPDAEPPVGEPWEAAGCVTGACGVLWGQGLSFGCGGQVSGTCGHWSQAQVKVVVAYRRGRGHMGDGTWLIWAMVQLWLW